MMDLKKNIIPESQFYLVVKLILLVGIIGMIWVAYDEYQSFTEYLTDDLNKHSFEIDDYIFKSEKVMRGADEKMVRYVTVKELLYSATEEYEHEILKTNYGHLKMAGLESHPSFLIRDEHQSFWKSQYYLTLILNYGSYIGFLMFVFFYGEINFKQDHKLFTKEIKVLIYGLTFGVYAVFFLNIILYGRLMLFLNREFSLGEHLIGGVSQEYIWLGLALTVAATYLEKAIPIQKEQDLTV